MVSLIVLLAAANLNLRCDMPHMSPSIRVVNSSTLHICSSVGLVANCKPRVEQLEAELGAGLLEEVIQVAEGENELVDTILESKA